MATTLALVTAAASETGLVRQNNEDAAYSGRWLFAVADGMGGHAAGEIASAAVIQSLRAHDEDVSANALLDVLGHAVTEGIRDRHAGTIGPGEAVNMRCVQLETVLSRLGKLPEPEAIHDFSDESKK